MTRTLFVIALAAASSVATAQPVVVTLSEWKLELTRDTVKAGAVTFTIKNGGTMTHAFFVRGDGVEKGTREVAARQEASLTLTLKAGTYEIYCPLSDLSHRAAGMTRKLIVTPAAPPPPAKKPGG